MQSTLIATTVAPWSWPWRAARTIAKVSTEDAKNGLQASDLILEGGLHVPHPALSSGIYVSSHIPLNTQLKNFSTTGGESTLQQHRDHQ